jgi:hypothetical protein
MPPQFSFCSENVTWRLRGGAGVHHQEFIILVDARLRQRYDVAHVATPNDSDSICFMLNPISAPFLLSKQGTRPQLSMYQPAMAVLARTMPPHLNEPHPTPAAPL